MAACFRELAKRAAVVAGAHVYGPGSVLDQMHFEPGFQGVKHSRPHANIERQPADP
jgi:hypothetical protein